MATKKRKPKTKKKTVTDIYDDQVELAFMRVPRNCRVAPTPALISVIAQLIRWGCWPGTAARACGVSAKQFVDWYEEGLRRPYSIYGRFSREMDMADARAEVRDTVLLGAGVPAWQSLAWRLGRRYPKNWGEGGTGLVPFDREQIAGPVESATNLGLDEGVELLLALEKAGVVNPEVIDVQAEPVPAVPVNGAGV